MTIELMKQALEALDAGPNAYLLMNTGGIANKLRQAIAEAEKLEPVAWGMENDAGEIYDCITPEEHAREEGKYTVALYRKTQQRKPLTDEQIISKAIHLSGLGTSPDVLQFARAIEAAHGIKEKNT